MTEPIIGSIEFNNLGGTGRDQPHFTEVSSTDTNDLTLLADPGNFNFSGGLGSSQQPFPDSGMEFAGPGQATNTQAFTDAFEQNSAPDMELQLDDFDISDSSLPLAFYGASQTPDYRFEPNSWPQTDLIADSEVPFAAGDFSSAPSDSGARSDDNRIPVTPSSFMPGLESRELSSNRSSPSSTGVHACSVCKRQLKNGRALREHMRSHDRRYPCDGAGCSRRFCTPRDLRRHRKSAHEKAVLECQRCSAHIKGGRIDNLKRHMKTCRTSDTSEKTPRNMPGVPSESNEWTCLITNGR